MILFSWLPDVFRFIVVLCGILLLRKVARVLVVDYVFGGGLCDRLLSRAVPVEAVVCDGRHVAGRIARRTVPRDVDYRAYGRVRGAAFPSEHVAGSVRAVAWRFCGGSTG